MNQITLYAISADEKVELLEALGHDGVRFETLPAEKTRSGEPVTIALIGLSAIAVTGLVAYLLKGRKSGRATIGHMVIATPKGTIELRNVQLEFEEEKEASAQMINALQKWMTGAIPKSG
jgi:hypothetical protein